MLPLEWTCLEERHPVLLLKNEQDDKHHHHNPQQNNRRDENLVGRIALLGKCRLIKGHRFGGRLLAELDPLRNDHGLIGQLFGRGLLRAGVFQPNFHLA